MAKCAECGAEIRHVRDNYTGATFPVDVEPLEVRGFRLMPPEEGERNQRAKFVTVELFEPHQVNCVQAEAEK